MTNRTLFARHVIAAAVAGAGVLNVVSAAVPAERTRLQDLREVVPLSATHIATTATMLAGVSLIVLARQLWNAKHVAMVGAFLLLAGSAALHVLKGLDVEEALVAAALAGVLIWQRRQFFARSDPASLGRVFRAAPLLLVGAFAYGVGAIFLNRASVQPAPTIAAALKQVLNGLAGVSGPLQETGRFARWFPVSLIAYGSGTLAFLGFLAFRPVIQKLHRTDADRVLARAIVSEFDADSLSYFALRDDKDYFFNASRTALLAYRYVAGVALVSGDPIGPVADWSPLLKSFRAFAAERDWKVAAIGTSPGAADVYDAAGMKQLYLGDEAIIDLSEFSLEGRKIRNVRQSANHVRREGYSCVVIRAVDASPALRAAAVRISHQWRGTSSERGFSMALGRLFSDEDRECLLSMALDGEKKLRGFLHLVPYASGKGYSLDLMRRDRSAPAGLNEFLIVETAMALRDQGVETLSLNFATFAKHLTPIKGFKPFRQTWRRTLLVLSRFFQIESLLRFNRKFLPRWIPRFVAYEETTDLPSAGIAMLQAEAFIRLPVVGRYF